MPLPAYVRDSVVALLKGSRKLRIADIQLEIQKLYPKCEFARRMSSNDVHNIRRQQAITMYDTKKHAIDLQSILLLIAEEELEHEAHPDKRTFRYFKKEGDSEPAVSLDPAWTRFNLDDDVTCLIMQTEKQRHYAKLSLLHATFPNDVVFIDSTHGTNRYAFSLFTIMVRQPLPEGSLKMFRGYPIAFMISNVETAQVVDIFFRVALVSSGIIPGNVLSDDDRGMLKAVSGLHQMEAWECSPDDIDGPSLPAPVPAAPTQKFNHFLCSFHVMKTFIKAASERIKDHKQRLTAIKVFAMMLNAPSRKAFDVYEFVFQEVFPPDHSIRRYFRDNFAARLQMWAHCARPTWLPHTTNHLESFHGKLKEENPALRKQRVRIDFLVSTLGAFMDKLDIGYESLAFQAARRKAKTQHANAAHHDFAPSPFQVDDSMRATSSDRRPSRPNEARHLITVGPYTGSLHWLQEAYSIVKQTVTILDRIEAAPTRPSLMREAVDSAKQCHSLVRSYAAALFNDSGPQCEVNELTCLNPDGIGVSSTVRDGEAARRRAWRSSRSTRSEPQNSDDDFTPASQPNELPTDFKRRKKRRSRKKGTPRLRDVRSNVLKATEADHAGAVAEMLLKRHCPRVTGIIEDVQAAEALRQEGGADILGEDTSPTMDEADAVEVMSDPVHDIDPPPSGTHLIPPPNPPSAMPRSPPPSTEERGDLDEESPADTFAHARQQLRLLGLADRENFEASFGTDRASQQFRAIGIDSPLDFFRNVTPGPDDDVTLQGEKVFALFDEVARLKTTTPEKHVGQDGTETFVIPSLFRKEVSWQESETRFINSLLSLK